MISGASAMISAVFTLFSSSRTLPGHEYASSAAIASSVKPRFGRPCASPNLRSMACASTVGAAAPLAQRRHVDGHFADAEVQVLAEALLDDQRLQIPVGGADDAHVDRDLLASADALDDAVLQEAQQLGLQRQRHVADLVEEQRAAVGGFDLADASACRRR